jgi:tetratricopeptide (TPR) repeat protein
MKRLWTAMTLVCMALLMAGANQISAYDKAAEQPAAVSTPPSVGEKAVADKPDYNEAGREYYREGNFGAAILEFNKQLEQNPGDVNALVNRGLSLARRGEYKVAIENLYNALIAKNNDVTILKYIAAIYYLDRAFQKSVDTYNMATTVENSDFDAIAGRGFGNLSMGRRDDAVKDFTGALFIAPRDKKSFVGRGISLIAVRNYRAAIADFGAALSISANDPFIYIARAEAHAGNGTYSGAVSDLNRACSLGYAAVCVAVSQARSEITGAAESFVLQYSRKAPDEELYDISRKNLEKFYVANRTSEINKYFIGMLKPFKD